MQQRHGALQIGGVGDLEIVFFAAHNRNTSSTRTRGQLRVVMKPTLDVTGAIGSDEAALMRLAQSFKQPIALENLRRLRKINRAAIQSLSNLVVVVHDFDRIVHRQSRDGCAAPQRPFDNALRDLRVQTRARRIVNQNEIAARCFHTTCNRIGARCAAAGQAQRQLDLRLLPNLLHDFAFFIAHRDYEFNDARTRTRIAWRVIR